MLLLQSIGKGLTAFSEYFQTDERVSSIPFLGSPWPMLAVIAIYLMIVLNWGPKFMAKRQPYKVDGIMNMYNVMQIVLNSAIFYEALKYSYLRDDFKLICQAYDPSDTRPITMKLLRPTILYYVSKYLDLLDTIFFLLRKKNNQITFLHVYHHCLMIAVVYAYCTKLLSSHFIITGVINSFIHVCMYTYYLLAATKPNIDLSNWKRCMTRLQLLQFSILAVFFGIPIVNNWCKLPFTWLLVAFIQNVIILTLFLNFYYKTYILKNRKQKKIATE